MITGVWKGKISGKNVELKLVLQGDILTGTVYYFESANSYRRYSVQGYFDQQTNEAVWWDDQLTEVKTGNSIFGSRGSIPYQSVADFNCPGTNKMYLDGKAARKDDRDKNKGPVHLEKTGNSRFNDEWDFIIDNYTAGANDPYLIDSVKAIAAAPPTEKAIVQVKQTPLPPVNEKKSLEKVNTSSSVLQKEDPPPVLIVKSTLSIEEKYQQRKKETIIEIPVTGDSIELRFYDNAEIDGDSISLFLDGKMIFQHIRLKASPFIIKIPVTDLAEQSELVMVAENLGEIPPNTAYMIVYCDQNRFDANLASTEETSATIKLAKSKPLTGAVRN